MTAKNDFIDDNVPLDIVDAAWLNEVAGKANTCYVKPGGGIPSTDMTSTVTTSLDKADTAYQKPGGGIPSTDMTSTVTTSLGKADTAYQKPGGGIPSTDMTSAVTTSLGKADTATQPADVAAAQLVTISAQTDSYTLVLGDATKAVEVTKATATNVTVPPNVSVAFPTGTVVEVVQIGAGQVIVVAGSGVTINSASSLKTRAQWSVLGLRKQATNTWILSGDME